MVTFQKTIEQYHKDDIDIDSQDTNISITARVPHVALFIASQPHHFLYPSQSQSVLRFCKSVILHEWNHTVCNLRLAFFIQHSSLEIHPGCC